MKIKLKDTNGITLKTKDKLCTEDIEIVVDDSIGNGITPTGTLSITSNGIYDVTNYASANVNVASSGETNTLKKLLDSTKSCYYTFYNYAGTSVTDLISYSDTENVTNMGYMFGDCVSLTNIPQLDTSKVNSMPRMFYYCRKITTIPQLNTSKVTDMSYMFYNCESLTNIPQLDTSNVTNMNYMFSSCKKLEKIDISYYGINSTTYSSNVFNHCYSLKAIIIRSFGTSYVLTSGAFTRCYHILGTVDSTYNPTGAKDAYIYVPRSMVSTLSSATNWATYASQLRALEDYTIDGTTTGELDESKVNA
jgi:surface protein